MLCHDNLLVYMSLSYFLGRSNALGAAIARHLLGLAALGAIPLDRARRQLVALARLARLHGLRGGQHITARLARTRSTVVSVHDVA